MTTIALLGSTGKTGREVLRNLLTQGKYELQIYVRSKSRLSGIFPGIEEDSRVIIFAGAATDNTTIKACLLGADIIICTLGNNDYEPTTILRDSARSILTALKEIKQASTNWHPPRMIYLSSSSQNKRFAAARPPGVDWLIKTAFQNGYADLIAAETLLIAETSLVSVLKVQPGILIEEEGTGYEISTESVRLAASYEDLGQAFVELALERHYDPLAEVGVSSKGGDRAGRYAPEMLSRILAGIFIVYIPGGAAIRRVLSRLW